MFAWDLPWTSNFRPRFQSLLVMSNVSHTNWSVCVFALLSCFCCFSALEIQNFQRASFYDSVSGLPEPPGEWIKPVGLPNRRVLSPQEALAGGWPGGRAGRADGVRLVSVFVSLIDLHEPFISCSVLFSFKATVWVHKQPDCYCLHIAFYFMHSTCSTAYKRYVTTFSSSAVLIHSPPREWLGINLLVMSSLSLSYR